MGALVTGPEAVPGDFGGEVLGSVLAEGLASPWLVGLLTLLVIRKVLQLGRAIVHGRHPQDPRRRFSDRERVVILARAGGRCEAHSWLLGRCRQTEGLQADHVHPHSRGGSTSVENGQALCARHNRRKSARAPWDWQLGRLEQRRRAYVQPDVGSTVVRHRPPVRPREG